MVTVSGDGGLYEVINGLYSRPDWPRVGQQVRVGIVPGGSGQCAVYSGDHIYNIFVYICI